MNDTKFKALTHAGQYVDAVLLIKGIYTCDIPRLYPHTETIEHMIEEAEKAVPWIWHKESLKTYIENLRKCQLADVLVVQAGGVSPKTPITKYKNKDGREYVLMDDGMYHAVSGANVFRQVKGTTVVTPGHPMIYTREQCEQYLTPVLQDSHKESA